MDIKKQIIKFCNDLGIELVGFTKCRRFDELEGYFKLRKESNIENEFEEEDIEKRINPLLLMPEGKTIISMAFPYYYKTENHSSIYFSKYTLGQDYHKVVKSYLEKVCTFIESLNGNSISFVDSNPLPERYIAAQSGIGFIGKNNTLITEKYGSYVFLGEIITDLIIEEDKPMNVGCESCNRCMKACPTKSINVDFEDKYSNPNICLSYVTQNKHIDEGWFDKFKGRIFGCDTCQIMCPYNKDVQESNLKEFKPNDFMEIANLSELIYLDNKVFKEKYKLTSCGWRGKNILKRNALIAAFHNKEQRKIDMSKIDSPYIKEYYDRLLRKFQL